MQTHAGLYLLSIATISGTQPSHIKVELKSHFLTADIFILDMAPVLPVNAAVIPSAPAAIAAFALSIGSGNPSPRA